MPVLPPADGDPSVALAGEPWPAKLESMAAILPIGSAPGAAAAGASGSPFGPSIVVCDEEDEPRIAAILSEMSLLGPVIGAAAAWLPARDAELTADESADGEDVDAGRGEVVAFAGALLPK